VADANSALATACVMVAFLIPNSAPLCLSDNGWLADAKPPRIPLHAPLGACFICLPLTIRFQGSVGGAINVTAEAFSQQVQDVNFLLTTYCKIGIYFPLKSKFLSLSTWHIHPRGFPAAQPTSGEASCKRFET